MLVILLVNCLVYTGDTTLYCCLEDIHNVIKESILNKKNR